MAKARRKRSTSTPPPADALPPDAEMADIQFKAALRQYAPLLTEDDIRVLSVPEARELWLRRREELRQQQATPGPAAAPQRRKPGPPPKTDWKGIVARELHSALMNGGSVPTATKLSQICGDDDEKGHYPDPSDIQKEIKRRLNRLLD